MAPYDEGHSFKIMQNANVRVYNKIKKGKRGLDVWMNPKSTTLK